MSGGLRGFHADAPERKFLGAARRSRGGANSRDLMLLVGVSLLAIGFRLASEQTGNLSYLFLAGYTFFGRAQVVQALTLTWLITMINPGLAPDASFGGAGRYVVFFAAAGSVLARSGFLLRWRLKPFTVLTLGLGGFFGIHSILVSPFPDVSVLKVLSWILVTTSLVSAWVGLRPEQRQRLGEQLFWGLALVLALSLPLLVMPEGYLRNGRGFQGILNHPQAFGPTLALLGAWALARFLGERRPRWSFVLLTILCLVLVLLSQSRTAGIAMVLGIGVASMLMPFLANGKSGSAVPETRSKRFQITALLMLLGVIAAGPTLNTIVMGFIAKGGGADGAGLFSAYEQSRGFLVFRMLDNIQQDPWVGVGFGISSDSSSMNITRDPIFALPVSASVEKGVMPVAVLEEVGIPGLFLVGIWIWAILRRSALGGLAPLTVATTVLLINMGESVLFSPGGMGLLLLILTSWAVSLGFGGKKPGCLST